MDQKEFEILLGKGLDVLYQKDYEIMDRKFNINERTVTHRLAHHLTDIFADYDVDCEYNRMVDHTGFITSGDYWVKTINLEIEENISGEDDEAKTVFPDIIIHKRNKPENLAVIEVKMKWKNTKKNFDYQKLKAYKSHLLYKFAIYLELNENLKSTIIDII